MDNRLRFLYRIQSELWGRGRRAWAGNGKTGTSEVGDAQENPRIRPEDVTWSELKVAKHASQPPRKAAIALYAPVP